MATTESTYYTTTSEADMLTSLEPLVTDVSIECLFDFSVSMIASIETDVTVCGYNDEDDRTFVSVTLNVPANRWGAVGFILNAAFDETQRMAGYAIVVPIYGRDVQEYFLTGRGAAGFGTPLESSITVTGDTIADGVRTLIFTRPLTVQGSDLSQSAPNLFNVDEGYYFDFANLKDCGQSERIIYAVGNEDEQFSIVGAGTPHAFTEPYRGALVVEVDVDEEGICDELDGAASIVVYVSAILALIGVVLV
eukprot:CAMPEP_0202726082 /NCGR_PEP_ID=MMETSP1385-20130828/184432_1 /ASSEMBLY_ACC=CAM_ASM_000861 /TAXON_ID=933848 /ORGANISM="Elphidium margaritaceum" /LENGTH=249 /DNA_ID=CAMNT_0049392295 /DNA_START=229 /DNA_END=978 /DNA_ORIENTATION=+